MEYMNELWIDTRLNEEEMNFLWDAISEENKENASKVLAGNIHKSELIKDKDTWFYENVLKKLTERMFYRDWDVYYKYCIEKEEPPPKFEMNKFWVNYQKQHEFNPPHDHGGIYSFVIWMKIPTKFSEQVNNPICTDSNCKVISNFSFLYTDILGKMSGYSYDMNPEKEGALLFFPSQLYHEVFPFFNCEEDRISVSGNITLNTLKTL